MNARDYKLFRPGEYYHVYNRGDNRENIFLDEQDYFNFLKRFKFALGLDLDTKTKLRIRPFPPKTFTIIAYCLMPNHFHMIIRQDTKAPIGLLINKVITSYAKYFNAKYGRVGNVFQDTFKAKLIDNDDYLSYLTAYIHNNPNDAIEYPFSSMLDYLGNRTSDLCDISFVLKYFQDNKQRYKEFVISNKKTRAEIQDLIFEE